jgi:hypothetical protein
MKTVARLPLILGFAGATLAPSLASAHVRLQYPTPRYPNPTGMDDSMNIKTGPCGRANDSRTTDMSRITVLEPGATIEVRWNETIGHPGFYRISFDDMGQDAFVAPTTRAMVDTMAPYTLPVLVDNIADIGNTGMNSYTQMVTLPNVECESCTLQLIQVMVASNVMMWTATGADPDIYFTCADIALRRGGGMGGAGGMGGTGGRGGAGAGGAGTTGGGAGGIGGTPIGGMSGAATGGVSGAATSGAGGVTAGTGGVATGGVAPTGGVGGAASGAPPGGMPAGGAPASGAPGAGAGTVPPAGEDPGCGCRTVPSRFGGHAFTAAALAVLGLALRRRRGSRSSAV